MADDQQAKDIADIAAIARAQEEIRRIIAYGRLPVEQEVIIRANAADLSHQCYALSGKVHYIHDAIQHLDTILRHLPRDSPDRPKHLSTLSYVKISEYLATNSRQALQEAINHGDQAKALAVTINLLNHDPNSYFKILTNFGFAHTQRYALLQTPEDLEGAILSAKEIYEKAPKDSEHYLLILHNLASRLRMRYLQNKDEKDINDALGLINELRSSRAPGTSEYISAVVQLGVMAADKFKQTNQLQDLDEALEYCKMGLGSKAESHETQVPLLRQIVDLYKARYQTTSEEADLRSLASSSGMLFHATPSSNTMWGKHLLNYTHQLHRLAITSRTLRDFRIAVEKTQPIMESIPPRHPDKSRCRRMFADLCFDQYSLSHDMKDLVACMTSVQQLTDDYNNTVDRNDTSKGYRDTKWIWDFQKLLRLLLKTTPSNQMRKRAETELEQMMSTYPQTRDYAGSVLEKFYGKSGFLLTVLGEAIVADQILTEDEINVACKKLEEKEATATRERLKRRRFKTDDYTTEFGLRKLAIDESKNIVTDMSGLMSDILGYDVCKKYTPEEFIALQAQGEQKALDEAKLKGRHPNHSLCRMCRDLVKVLEPTLEGFELTAKKAYLPFGNYFQLRERKFCSICSLILSGITTKSGELHPRLAAMDPEVQGVRLSTGRLSTNEQLMRFDYGMKPAGELRIVTNQNLSQVSRQAWGMVPPLAISNCLDNRGSSIYDRSQQGIHPGRVKSWLNMCDHNHGSACNHPRSGKRAKDEIRLVLIDVKEERLIVGSSDKKYFALSYVWGKVKMSKTLKSNYEARTQPGSLALIPFPKTIRDAMTFVRSLGEIYLWVDAICLIQDDKDRMAQDVINMDIVYGKAFATLVALEGNDADAGLPGVRAGTREPQIITTISISDKSADLDDNDESDHREKIYLTATPRPLHLALELSQWNSRCWIMQEHLLSKRCLYFASDALYFQCGEQTLSEGGANEIFETFRYGIALGDKNIMEEADRSNPLSSLSTFYDLSQRERIEKAFNAYTKLVGIYSKRQLSFKSDIVNAFAGMFAVLEEYFEGTTVYGLPTSVISHALLWSPGARLPRRGCQLPTRLTGPISNPDPQFPSWSWIGWEGSVEYRLFELSKEKRDVVLPIPSIKVYQTINGPVSDRIQEERKISTSMQQDPDMNGQGGARGSAEDHDILVIGEEKELPKKQILAKMVHDGVRNSTWVITAPQVPQNRKDPYLQLKMLRFTARTVTVPAFQIRPTKEYLSSPSQVHSRSSQAVRRICDRKDKHCGLWWEQAGYGYVGLGISPEAESKIDMLEISRYGDAYRSRDGPYLVEGPISIFDNEAFPAMGPGSGLVNILVVDRDMGLPDGIGERCTVAVIHAAAWEAANPQEKEIQIV